MYGKWLLHKLENDLRDLLHFSTLKCAREDDQTVCGSGWADAVYYDDNDCEILNRNKFMCQRVTNYGAQTKTPAQVEILLIKSAETISTWESKEYTAMILVIYICHGRFR